MKKLSLLIAILMLFGLISCSESSPSGVDYNDDSDNGKSGWIKHDLDNPQPVIPAKKDVNNLEDNYDSRVSKK